METSNWLWAGIMAGLVFGSGLFFWRRQAWETARTMGWISLALAGLGVVTGAGIAISSMSGGGDAVIAGMTFLVFSVAGAGLAGLLTVVLGGIQSRALGRPAAATMLTCLADPLLFGIAVWVFISAVVSPLHRERADASWRAELDRRKRVESLERSIPPNYRNMPLDMIDQHNRMRRQMQGQGSPIPPLVPPETEQKMRELASLKGRTSSGYDIGSYQRIEEAKKQGILGLGVGWLAGAIAIPFGFALWRPKRLSG